jgi:hypothetical protein
MSAFGARTTARSFETVNNARKLTPFHRSKTDPPPGHRPHCVVIRRTASLAGQVEEVLGPLGFEAAGHVGEQAALGGGEEGVELLLGLQ